MAATRTGPEEAMRRTALRKVRGRASGSWTWQPIPMVAPASLLA